MADDLSHPMDDFPVRPLQFEVSKLDASSRLWSRTCPEFSMFVNALGIHVPYFERYLVRTMTRAKAVIESPSLRRDMVAISGQEAHHAKNFIAYNQYLATQYPRVAAFEAEARTYFSDRAKRDSLKQMVAFSAGYETFTFLGGMIVLDNHARWFEDADPTVKALWVWHQVEEVEHGAVAFEVYQHLYGRQELYRKWNVLTALLHIAKETLRAYVHMAKVEGWFRNPFRGLWKTGFCVLMLCRFVRAALPVFSRSYHPRRHPFVTQRQNPIQIAWRRYERTGGDVLEIDRHKMQEIMGIQPEA